MNENFRFSHEYTNPFTNLQISINRENDIHL